MTSNVDFYEKLKNVQEFQHNSEGKRLELEKQLNQYMKSDHRLARLKAVRLQNYWKKLCEDEKRSNWRNEQLLKDIERVENQMSSLSVRTDRLKTMKRQYEEYIERVYPQWKEKVLAYQEIKKQQAQADVEKYAAAAQALQQGSAMPGTGFPATSTPLATMQGMGQQGLGNVLPPSLQQPMANPVNQQALINQQLLQQQQQHQYLYQQQQQQQVPMYQQQAQNTAQQLGVPQIKLMGSGGGGAVGVSPGSTMQTVSDLPTGYSLTSNIQHQQQHQVSFGTMESTAFSTGEYGVPPEGCEDVPCAPEPELLSDHSTSYKVTAVQHHKPQFVETPRDEDTWRSEEPPSKTPRDEPVPRYANVPPPTDDDFADTSEFASDVELPLSGHEEYNEKPQPTPRSACSDSVKSRESVEHNVVSRQSSAGSIGRLSRQQSVELDKPVYPQADVTLEGLYNLLSAVQDTFPGAFSPEEYYRGHLPPMSVRKDVISNANKGTTLSHIGGESMSMVVLDQLPLVCLNCEGGCLLQDDFLFNPPVTLTSNLVRAKVHLTSTTLWDKLYEHFAKIIKYNIMRPNEVATIFAALLISKDSPYEEQAYQVLTTLLENLPSEDLQPSPNSSATLSSLPLSPKGKPSFTYQNNDEETDLKQPLTETRLDPTPQQTNVQPPEAMSSIQLTQTAAYRQLLGDTGSTQKSVTYEDSDDSSLDSVEKALKAHSLATSPRSDAAPQSRKVSEPMVVPTGT